MLVIVHSILKIDFTNARYIDANTASWATNLGNGGGMSVQTTSEAISCVTTNGSWTCEQTQVSQATTVFYTNRDCCSSQGPSKFQVLFHKWDLWHYMRRITVGCMTESRRLCGTFMSRLSSAIFEWTSSTLCKRFDFLQATTINVNTGV